MWTGLKENSEYTGQITPYHGKVNAEIIMRNKKEGFYESKIDLWLTVMDKSFGSSFASQPREKDYLDAQKWINEQLELIEKHATVMVTKPKFLNDK